MRSLLFVPADSPRKLARAAECEADALIVDLEDSVAPRAKAGAREAARRFLEDAGRAGGQQMVIRINGLDSGLAEADLAAVIPGRPGAVLLPKCRSGADAEACGRLIEELERTHRMPEGEIRLIVLATETAGSLFNMASYAAGIPRLAAITWGAEDLSAELGATAIRDPSGALSGPYALARTLTLLAARAANAEPIDGIYAQFRDLDGLRQEAEAAARDGFSGKLAIHPDQITTINAAFTPSPAAVAEAQAIADAFAARPGAGVVSVDGTMLDRPHLLRAERLLARARLADRSSGR